MGRYQALTERPWLRRGLRVVRLGAVVGISAVLKVAAAASVLAGRPGSWEGAVSAVLSASCVVLVGIGLTMPMWGPRASGPVRWIRRARSHRALRPLWADLRTPFPEVARRTPSGRSSLTWRLARRGIEIEDALLLAPYRPPRAEDPVPADPQPAAADIREALSAAARGGAQRRSPPPIPAAVRAASDLDIEADRLGRLARAYRRLPTSDQAGRRDSS